MKNKTPKSQVQATRRWEEKNREHVRKQNYLRTARLYFRTYADDDDVGELLDIYKKENPNGKKTDKCWR
ncbi:hypothetical protein [Anaerococcus sp. Marseille-P3625]|uniref:hypothetical protein n=1 Tax=Anaerococcus sp. Marseille-P3625 TaxID=1977277 RepID=UPI000C078338|nr:hypothetical protein [Anaerococcus sp. Marseille-P3625]